MTPQQALAQLVAGQDLSREAMRAAMMAVMTGEASAAQIGALLVALRMKGEATTKSPVQPRSCANW